MSEQLQARLRAALGPELEVERAIGRGTTATVFLAREPSLERLVAVKVLRPDIAADPVARSRFEREARAAARITHANVTSIFRVGSLPDGLPYIVMEYVDGRTLGERVEATGALALDEACDLLTSLASALAAAHDRGIVHRDVRPSNIFLENRTGRAVLADFGIAALKETGSEAGARLTATGVRLGQIEYNSPEELEGEKATEQSDIYALGLVAYMALAGRGPYDAANASQLARAHLTGKPRPLSELRPGVDPGLAELVTRCLAKEPRRRPVARDLVEALGASGRATHGVAPAHLAAPEGSFDAFLHELKRRRVYRMAVRYGTFLLALFGLTEILFEAFLPRPWLVGIVTAGLLGFPIALSLSWIFEIRDGRPLVTRSFAVAAGPARPLRARLLPWIGLVTSIAAAAVIGWVLLF